MFIFVEILQMNLEDYLKSIANAFVLDPNFVKNDYFKVDLSDQNWELQTFDIKNTNEFQIYLDKKASENNSKIAYGGYLEPRLIYKHNQIFKNPNVEERNIHLGVDLWLPAHSSIFCALEGRIHSFQNNKNPGDYGPTIIIEHNWNNLKFHTLYGHLSTQSLENLTVGQHFKQGDYLAKLGLPLENGNYAPHLHFQIILDLEQNFGDYPGVSSKENLVKYAANCPNPLYLLNLPL